MKVTGTSSYIKIETDNKVYRINGERLIHGFLAYFNTLSYWDNDKEKLSIIEEQEVKKKILDFNKKNKLKIEIEESETDISKSKAWKIINETILETERTNKSELLNSKDIIKQLKYLEYSLLNPDSERDFSNINLNTYAQQINNENPKYSLMLSNSFGIMTLMKYGKL